MTMLCNINSDTACLFFPREEKKDFTVLQTPFLYPDGDCISLYIEKNEDGITVTDFGETVRWLHGNTQSLKRTLRQNLIIQDICLTHDVEFVNGALQVSGLQESDVSETVFRVCQAAIRVSDIWLTFRNRTIQSATDEISAYFDENSIKYTPNAREKGMSGKEWVIDFRSETSSKHSLISLLSTGSRQSAKSKVEHVVTCFLDIKSASENGTHYLRVSLIDDTNDIWEDSDFKLLSQVSELTYWTEPDKILEIIGA